MSVNWLALGSKLYGSADSNPSKPIASDTGLSRSKLQRSPLHYHVYLSSYCTGAVTLGIFVRLCSMCTSDVRLWPPYHITDQDAECYYNSTGTGQVPGCNNIYALPYSDVG